MKPDYFGFSEEEMDEIEESHPHGARTLPKGAPRPPDLDRDSSPRRGTAIVSRPPPRPNVETAIELLLPLLGALLDLAFDLRWSHIAALAVHVALLGGVNTGLEIADLVAGAVVIALTLGLVGRRALLDLLLRLVFALLIAARRRHHQGKDHEQSYLHVISLAEVDAGRALAAARLGRRWITYNVDETSDDQNRATSGDTRDHAAADAERERQSETEHGDADRRHLAAPPRLRWRLAQTALFVLLATTTRAGLVSRRRLPHSGDCATTRCAAQPPDPTRN